MTHGGGCYDVAVRSRSVSREQTAAVNRDRLAGDPAGAFGHQPFAAGGDIRPKGALTYKCTLARCLVPLIGGAGWW